MFKFTVDPFLRFLEGEGGDGGSSEGGNSGEGGQGGAQGDETNWREKFEAQRKINQDLEKKVKGEAGTLKSQLEESNAKYEKLLAEHEGREKEFQAEQERRKVESEALEKANHRIRQAEIRAAAKGELADPEDALLYLDLSSFEVGEDGSIDADKVSGAIQDLIKSKPYLAAQGGKRFQGSVNGGSRNEDSTPQLSRSDLEGMTPDEINTARAKGQLKDLLGGK